MKMLTKSAALPEANSAYTGMCLKAASAPVNKS